MFDDWIPNRRMYFHLNIHEDCNFDDDYDWNLLDSSKNLRWLHGLDRLESLQVVVPNPMKKNPK